MTDPLTLAEIRAILGLDPTPYDLYWFRRQRELYAAATHEVKMWTDVEPGPDGYSRLVERPMTIHDAMAWASHTMGGS
jgi:hypothetical protein